MLKIEMEDLFYGFIRNYVTFGIRPDVTWTKWTNEILGYYAELGKMIGCYTEYEWKRFDLVWFWDIEDIDDEDPWLHIEHENSPDRLDELLSKIDQSPSENIIVIGYPISDQAIEDFIVEFEKMVSKKEKGTDVLAIMDKSFYTEDIIPIVGFYLRSGRKSGTEYVAKKRITETEIFFAYPE